MRRRLVLACVLVAAALLAGGVVAGLLDAGTGPLLSGPADQTGDAATGTTSTPTETNDTTETNSTDDAPDVADAVANYTGERFVATALASDGDATLAGGSADVQTLTADAAASNASVLRVSADGDVAWAAELSSENRTGITAIAPAADGGAYVVRTEQVPRENRSEIPEVDVALVRLDDAGDQQWREPLNTAGYLARGLALTQTTDGVAVAYSGPDRGVSLRAFDDAGDQTFDRTYGAEAVPTALSETDDGFLVAGTGDFRSAWVLRTGADGEPVLNETYEGGGDVRVAGAVPTDDGGAVLAGHHRADFGAVDPMPWASRVDGDGVQEWSRVYPTGEKTRVQEAFATEDGVVLVGSDRAEWGDETVSRLVGVGLDGTELFQANASADGRTVAATGGGDSVTVATMNYRERNASGGLTTLELPDIEAGGGLDADVGPSSNESVYRGQNLGFEHPDAAGETYDLVRVPGEHADFERHAERRVAFRDDGTAVVESATLPPGEYVLESPDGDVFAVDDGSLQPAEDGEHAAFGVDRQDVSVEVEDAYVDATTDDATVAVNVDSRRSNYSVYVSASRFRGGAASTEALRDAFADTAGFAGVETVDGRPVARIDLGPEHATGSDVRRYDQTFDASAGAFDAGLYRLRVAATDTRDGGAADTTRLVVGKATADPLDVTLENDSLTVPVGNETATNVTVSGLDDGVGAMSMSANRTGDPAVSLRADLDVQASRGEGSGRWSSRRSAASAAAFDANTTEGTVTVGELRVQARDRIDVDGNATNTVTFGLDWVVDEDGTPYALPDEQTITVDVTEGESESENE